MALIQKKLSSAFVTANRANSRRSTGPRTELGKRHSRRNAGKHLIYAAVFAPSMKELGENPADFARLRDSLRQAFKPQDGFEEMLVEDMLVTRWRLGRARRAEMGILAVQQFRLEHRLRAAPANRQASYDNIMVQSFGLAGVSDSPEKYLQILELLQSLRVGVEREGFTPQGLEVLKTVYGPSPGVTGVGLILRYKAQLERLKCEAQTEGEEERGAAHESFTAGQGYAATPGSEGLPVDPRRRGHGEDPALRDCPGAPVRAEIAAVGCLAQGEKRRDR